MSHNGLFDKPRITLEEEIAEMEALDARLALSIECDLRGMTARLARMQVQSATNDLLYMLNREISKLPSDLIAVYNQANMECPELVDNYHKMKFLEREDNNPVMSASRLVRYWKCRMALFGPERCFLPMTLTGAMQGEIANMIMWPVRQFLPVKDTAGRAILVFRPELCNDDKYNVEQQMMALLYQIEAAIEDPEVRHKGIIFISHGKDMGLNILKTKTLFLLRNLINVIPVHIRAVHIIYSSKFVHKVSEVVKYFVGDEMRLRHVWHHGSEEKVLKDLENNFCLPRRCLPTEVGGDVVLDMGAFIANRLELEMRRAQPY